jgi:hypothetical protein
VDECLKQWIYSSGGLYYFYLKIFLNFKVLDIILEEVGHTLVVDRKDPIFLEEVSHILISFKIFI